LLTLDGWGHTSFLARSACIQQFEADYLLTGALPPAGTVCQPDHVPFAPTTPQQAAAERSPFILTAPAQPATPALEAAGQRPAAATRRVGRGVQSARKRGRGARRGRRPHPGGVDAVGSPTGIGRGRRVRGCGRARRDAIG